MTATLIEQTREIPLGSIDKNPWNPNEMNAAELKAQRESLLKFGFIDFPHVWVNPASKKRFQLIDGEHRVTLMQEFKRDGLPEGAHPSLVDLLARGVIPCTALDNITEADAMKLTLVLNGGGKNNQVKLGDLLAKIRDRSGTPEQALVALPYSPLELTDMTKIGAFDWNAVRNEQEAAKAAKAANNTATGSKSGDDFVRFSVAMPKDAYEVYQQALDLIKESLESDGQELHAKQDLAHGQALEALSAEYLAIPSLTSAGGGSNGADD